MSNITNTVICLMGPTAVGKTALAIALTERLPCEIISVDSAMIYREMDIGTAKPTAAELARAPHRLINIIDPQDSYSVGEFRQDALQEIAAIQAKNKIPLLVGGTMMYFHVLQNGIAELPTAEPDIRAKILREAEEYGWQHLHDRLRQIDPTSAARIHPNDPQRLQRALEVYEISGSTLSELLAKQAAALPNFNFINLVIMPPDREYLHAQIEKRFHLMLEQGFVAEVSKLYQRGDLSNSLPSIRCVGYRQVWDYLNGEQSYENMIEKGIIATRQLAKRQITWLQRWKEAPHYVSNQITVDDLLVLVKEMNN